MPRRTIHTLAVLAAVAGATALSGPPAHAGILPVSVAIGDVNGDGKADVITGIGRGSGPRVKVFGGADNALLPSFFAFAPTSQAASARRRTLTPTADPTWSSGPLAEAARTSRFSTAAGWASWRASSRSTRASPAASSSGDGDILGNGRAGVLVGPGQGNYGSVLLLDLPSGASNSFQPFDNLPSADKSDNPFTDLVGGVRVASKDISGDGKAEIFVSTGGDSRPTVRVFDGATLNQLDEFSA